MLRNENKIIPLGQNCMPRTVLTRFKIKPAKKQGELTYPFDLAVFGMREITKILKNDFSEFFSNLEYNGKIWIKRNTADENNNCIEFHHEKNLKVKDRDKLIQIYTARIENFRNAVMQDNPIIFFQITSDVLEAENQYNELKRIRADKPFKFLIVNTGFSIPAVEKQDLYILNLPFPCPSYEKFWWKKEYYDTPYGRLYEEKMADFCLKHLNFKAENN